MPSPDDLPEQPVPLARRKRNAVALGEARFDEDLDTLLDGLEAGAAPAGGAVHLTVQPT
jgi:hypothetical protein